jgi:hypothetical protein
MSSKHNNGDARVEKITLLQVLRDDHTGWFSRAELEVALSGVEPLAISDALVHLHAEGVVHLDGERVWASRRARHMDTLGVVAI